MNMIKSLIKKITTDTNIPKLKLGMQAYCTGLVERVFTVLSNENDGFCN